MKIETANKMEKHSNKCKSKEYYYRDVGVYQCKKCGKVISEIEQQKKKAA